MVSRLRVIAGFFALSGVVAAHAVVLAQWDFNASSKDPAIGSGVASYVGGTGVPSSGEFATGSGSSDPVQPGKAWNSANYPQADVGNKTAGVRFLVSTAGYRSIRISYDQQNSNSASRYSMLQYTLDGSSWIDGQEFSNTNGATPAFAPRSVDLSAVAGAQNNPAFGFRIVSMFAPGQSKYIATKDGTAYGTTGTMRFDMVTVTAEAVPEPFTMALGAAGLAVAVARRRRSKA